MSGRKTIHPIAKRILLLAGVSLLCFLLSETAITLLASNEWRHARYMESNLFYQHNPEWVTHNAALGFRNRPNVTAHIRRDAGEGGFDITVAINSKGYRDDEQSLDHPDILLLGDSFAFGWGVEKEESVEALLEKKTGKRVLNMAVSGYGTAQQFLQLKKWCGQNEMRGKQAFILFYENDWIENMGVHIPLYPAALQDPDGKTNYVPVKKGALESFQQDFMRQIPSARSNWSQTTAVCRTLYRAWRARSANPEAKPFDLETIPTPEMVATMELVLSDLATLRDQRGFRLTLVRIPPYEIYRKAKRPKASEIETLTKKYDIPLLSLDADLSKEDYYSIDWHWNASGHAKAAAAIAKLAE